jgi:molybdate transport system substrate-binding protein
MHRTMKAAVVASLFALLACSKNSGKNAQPLRVAAAADLALAFAEVGKAFEKQSGKHVDFSFGSTGLLAKQITEGAPFDVFAAANISFVDDVVRAGACMGETKRLYAKGRIVLWAKDPWLLPKDIGALDDARYAKVALANPEHAPYGRAAREALTKAGVWKSVEPRAVYGENIQQTLMFARTGNADVALVALSLAVASPGNYIPIDPTLHEPLDQAVVVCNGGARGDAKATDGRAFVDFIASEPGRAIMRRYGFLLPGEELASGDHPR